MAKWRVPVTWTMSGDCIVDANTEEDAIELAKDMPMPEGEYCDDSFSIWRDGIEILSPDKNDWTDSG